MVLIETLTEIFINHNNWAYVILFLGAYFETFFGLGFIIYGELFFLAGAILAGSGALNIYIVFTVAIIGGILGDSTGYWIGKRFGKPFLKKIFKAEKMFFNIKNYNKAKDFFRKHGKKSIFLGRFAGPMSCVFPFLAGSMHIKYKDFLKYNVPAVILGISQFLLVGYIFGYSYV
ncbi:MAG: DedA family protein, partial [archaeon]